MSIKKTGTPEKIIHTASSDADFDKLKDTIAKENNLARCKTCGKLIAKLTKDGSTINVQKSKLDVIAKASEVSIKCPKCGEVNEVVHKP